MKYERQTRDEVIAHIRENGEWKGRLAFEEHKEWQLDDIYLNMEFFESDLVEIDNKTIVDMRVWMATQYMLRQGADANMSTPILFFRAVAGD